MKMKTPYGKRLEKSAKAGIDNAKPKARNAAAKLARQKMAASRRQEARNHAGRQSIPHPEAIGEP